MSNDIKDFIDLAKNINQVNSLPKSLSLIADKYDKYFNIQKQYISKILICVESTLYKLLKQTDTLVNLNHNSCNRFLNPLLSNHFNLTYHMIHMDKYNCQYFEIMSKTLEEPKLHVLHRIIYVIIDFYTAIKRTNLKIDTLENYLNDFMDQFDLIFDSMKTIIYEGFSKKIDLPFSEYVKSYNPFNIQLELEDYDDDDEFNEED